MDAEAEWKPIETAPELDRVIACGWQKRNGRTPGYWWWHEDAVFESKAVEHPEALYWTKVVLPKFPPEPMS